MTTQTDGQSSISRCSVLACKRSAVTLIVGAAGATAALAICQVHRDAIQDGTPWRVHPGDPKTVLVGDDARGRRPGPPPPPVMTLVDDPDHGPVAVWWRSNKRNTWLCSHCGPSATASCQHSQAAEAAMGEPSS